MMDRLSVCRAGEVSIELHESLRPIRGVAGGVSSEAAEASELKPNEEKQLGAPRLSAAARLVSSSHR